MIAFSRGGWGWLILGLVLLVPLVSFWQWWQGMNSRRRDGQLSRTPPSAFAGTASPANLNSASFSSPLGGSSSSSMPAVIGSKLPLALPVSTASAAEKVGPSGQKSLTASTAKGLSGASSMSGALSPAGPTPNPMKEDLPGYGPKVDRDPTLSPPDIVRLQAPKEGPKRVAGPGRIEDRIELTGIIATPRGINAIVNNERVRKNDEVLGARIVRITQTCVDFEYHRKTFKKCIQ